MDPSIRIRRINENEEDEVYHRGRRVGCGSPLLGIRIGNVLKKDEPLFFNMMLCFSVVMMECLFYGLYFDLFHAKIPENGLWRLTLVFSTLAFFIMIIEPYLIINPFRAMMFFCWVFWELIKILIKMLIWPIDFFIIKVSGLIGIRTNQF